MPIFDYSEFSGQNLAFEKPKFQSLSLEKKKYSVKTLIFKPSELNFSKFPI